MKELSIKEKAKRYDEAIERAKEMIKDMPNIGGVAKVDDIQYLFPELKESEDERIRKELIAFLKETIEYGGISPDIWTMNNAKKWIAWLEKQGEQKSAKNIVETWKDMRLEVYQQASGNRHEPNYSDDTTKMFSLNDIDEIIEKMSEQKPADKVEPKFHVNEWVVTDKNDVVQIKAVNNGYYTIDNGMDFNMPYVDRYWHKWTIQDAKDGDVIYLPNGNNEYYFFIFKGIENATVMSFAHFYQYNDGTSEVKGKIDNLSSVNDDYHPATKEQSELLFQKMKEAGYKWDAEKKELKKIEHSPAWSEDDENINHSIIDILTRQGFQTQVNWLKSLRPHINVTDEELAQAKKDAYNDALDKIEYHSGEPTFDDGWSAAIWYLKKRNAQPQNTWKPNEEQMKALSNINLTGCISYAGQGQELINLYNDLKKLKG